MALELSWRAWRAPAAALLLGASTVAAYAPLAWWPLLWLLLGGLVLLLDAAPDARRATVLGACFGFGAFATGVSWVYVSLSQFSGLPPALSLIATILFCLYLALFPALASGLYRRWRSAGAWRNALLFAGLWGLAEWLRGWLLSGFPWLAIGYSQTPGAGGSPLSGYAPLLGVFGVSTLTALVAALLAEWLRRYFAGAACALPGAAAGMVEMVDRAATPGMAAWLKSCNAVPATLIVVVLVVGQALREVRWTEPSAVPLKVALLQGNVAQSMKWEAAAFADSLRTYHELVRDHPAALTILPETALPTFFNRLPAEYLALLATLARRDNGDILLGSVVSDEHGYTNSVLSLGGSPQQIYSKTHLVPFGEFVPPGFDWFVRRMNIPMSSFSPGGESQSPLDVAGRQVAINICYEDLFGEEIIGAASKAGILVNVSNTAWFGRSWAQPQHLQIARMRAAETGRPMLRATNTGMTAAISADGSVQAVLEPFTRGALVAEVQAMQGMTPFMRMGNGGALVLMAILLLPALIGRILRTAASDSR